MPSTKKHSRRRGEAVSPALRFYFQTGRIPSSAEGEVREGWLDAFLSLREGGEAAVWRLIAEGEVRAWAEHHPGTRPWAWWRFTAPAPRRRLGGIGTPSHEVLGYVPAFAFGLPTLWIEPFDVEYYQGRARDIHGRLIGQEFAGRTFAGQAIDPDDPPRFEGEAAYLERLGLWVPGEKRRAPAEAFDDELVRPEPDEE